MVQLLTHTLGALCVRGEGGGTGGEGGGGEGGGGLGGNEGGGEGGGGLGGGDGGACLRGARQRGCKCARVVLVGCQRPWVLCVCVCGALAVDLDT